MKFLFGILMLFTLAAAGQAQDPKLAAEIIASTSTKIVKGAPFSAEAISESVQVLADGNKITRSGTIRMYRDGEGRFRREEMPKQIGIPGSYAELQQTILILDPVAGIKLILNPASKTARQLGLKDEKQQVEEQMQKAEAEKRVAAVLEKAAAVTAQGKTQSKMQADEAQAQMKNKLQTTTRDKEAVRAAETESKLATTVQSDKSKMALESVLSGEPTKTESLGTRKIEGVEAEGTRSTKTIPAGAIGNERAIDIVYERWYSKDLQQIVLSKHSDPRFGEQTYRLTNINRSEPPRSLFSLPADYTLVNEQKTRPKRAETTSPEKEM